MNSQGGVSAPRSIACAVCKANHAVLKLTPGQQASCGRCGHFLARNTPHSLALTTAFTLSALLFYVPANLFPILRMTMFGHSTETTIGTGVMRFLDDGEYFVAIVVFLASILVPFLKIVTLFGLVVSTRMRSPRARGLRTKFFMAVESLGRWAMLDVFVLAVLVSLIKLDRMASVIVGQGALAFVLVVLFTILASASFDPRLIWEERMHYDST